MPSQIYRVLFWIPWYLVDGHRLIYWAWILESLGRAGWNKEPAGCSLRGVLRILQRGL